MEPYRLSDLERLLERIRSHRLVRIGSIGHTVAGRHRDRPRWRPGGSESRLRPRPGASLGSRQQLGCARADRAFAHRRRGRSRRFLRSYNVSILPMANVDGVARGGTRFNLRGMDLNRGWDKPADPTLSPENAALEH